mmetsp:Transcript_45988/g.122034  ORF Transcript_45988/g.122034 Transcript_45988/m.122034 type:complete len:112 (-) Transcript_45988:211-546(-)
MDTTQVGWQEALCGAGSLRQATEMGERVLLFEPNDGIQILSSFRIELSARREASRRLVAFCRLSPPNLIETSRRWRDLSLTLQVLPCSRCISGFPLYDPYTHHKPKKMSLL